MIAIVNYAARSAAGINPYLSHALCKLLFLMAGENLTEKQLPPSQQDILRRAISRSRTYARTKEPKVFLKKEGRAQQQLQIPESCEKIRRLSANSDTKKVPRI